MNKKILYGFVALVILIGGTYTYTQKDGKGEDGDRRDDVTIGVIAGTTGEYAFVGENWVKGVKLAQSDWNTAHPGTPVELVTEDDGFDAAKGLAAYKKLTTFDKVDAINNMTSVTIDAIYNDVVKQGIPLVQMGEQGIEPENDNVLQVMEGNIVTEKGLGEYAKVKGYKNLAVFVSNNATFERFYSGFAEGYGSEHKVYRVNPGDGAIKTQVLKALSEKPDAVAILMVPPDGAVVVREVKTLTGTETPILLDGSALTGWTEYEKILGDTTMLNGDAVVIIKQSAIQQKFTDAYKTTYGEEPGIGSTWGYESLTFLLETMGNDPTDHATWIKNMKSKQVESIGGIIKFDEVGVRLPEFFIGIIRDGKLPVGQ